VSAANEYLYIAADGPELPGGGSCGETPFGIFDNFENLYFTKKVSSCEFWTTVDNAPESDSFGNYYLYSNETPSGGSAIVMRDGYNNPVDFTGSASYIDGDEITGTPRGPLGRSASGGNNPEMSGITVDGEGHLWVIDHERGEIDEFDATTGLFIQGISAKSSGAPHGINPAGEHLFNASPGLTAVAVDPTNGDVLVSEKTGLVVDEFSPQGKYLGQLSGAETPAGTFGYQCAGEPGNEYCHDHVSGVAVNSEGYVYVADGLGHVVDIFGPRPAQPTIDREPNTNPTTTSEIVNATVDPNGGGSITSCQVEYGSEAEFQNREYNLGPVPCAPDPGSAPFSAPTQVHAEITGLTPETTYHFRFSVGNANVTRIGSDQTITTHRVLGLRAEAATGVTASSGTLHGSFVGNGADTHYWFEYGTTTSYGHKLPLPVPPGGDAGSPAGPARTAEEVSLSGLPPVTRYHYRIVAENGSTSYSEDESFRTKPLLPQAKEFVTDAHSNQIVLHAQVNPGGADTVFNFEYGTSRCSEEPDPCSLVSQNTHIGSDLIFNSASMKQEGLQPGTTYYYRIIATNSQGTSYSRERTFSTFPFESELRDACPNALARQQTGAALLSDCRGYELVSASNAGGYDVESNLVPGQMPFDGYPRAEEPLRVLYGVHNGAIPGVGGPPANRGVDPYVATRGESGWTTEYVGIPADNPNATVPFSSTLAEADPSLDSFAFGGSEICSPCFGDGSTGVPLHLPDGSLVQGMQGSIPQPEAEENGLVMKRFSADGNHFVFSSTSQFEPAGNDETGDVSIYDRDLSAGETQVVSTDPLGQPLACLQGTGTCHGPGDADGISELDISEDGSRVLVGQKISTDADGNDYYHLYLHVGTDPDSIDLTPGATAGALYDGMTADGSRIFFTTKDRLLPAADTDASADIYEARIEGASATLRLISTSGANSSNDDSCTPAGNWNTVSGEGKCNAVAFAGGAGVASGNGTIYFLSPELLAGPGEGEAGQPNIYVVKPDGSPEFVATIETGAPAVIHAVSQSATHDWGDFQVTPGGNFAAFATTRPLDEEFENLGYAEVYRYADGSRALDCVSCSPTNELALGDASLASNGLSLVDDGRVFFDSEDPLVLRDSDNRKDVYEWEEEGAGNCAPGNPNLFPTGICFSLITSGSSPFDSSLLSASADGTDVFFFTHDSLASGEDLNGPLTKIYDARTNGGFFKVPPPALCAASDECHGPGTTAAAPPPIRTVAGAPGNKGPSAAPKCKKGFVKKHGKCVRKKQKKHGKQAGKQHRKAAARNHG
jgi:hypothetical protein